MDDALSLANRLALFRSEAHQILGRFESSQARTVTLDESYSRLDVLSVKQDDLFRQALRCVEVNVFRAAHVMGWAGFIDCIQNLLSSDNFTTLNRAYPGWNISSLDQLREGKTEFSLIDALHSCGLINKSEKKAFHGMLSKRNECAHPAEYYPTFNETLGYIAELFSRLEALQGRYPGLSLI